LYRLPGALVLAGAQAQLVSLWKVADAQTQTLMVDYYQRLLKGEGAREALAMIANPATPITEPLSSHPQLLVRVGRRMVPYSRSILEALTRLPSAGRLSPRSS
jgi:hypothetical protein